MQPCVRLQTVRLQDGICDYNSTLGNQTIISRKCRAAQMMINFGVKAFHLE